MEDCIFCRIVAEEIPCSKVYEDDLVLAFHDVNPAAPTHVLVIPKKHFTDITTLSAGDMKYVAAAISVIQQIARELELDSGFRVVVNTGSEAGQTVPHLHFHLLGGRKMEWPPG
ncbi:Purine nucleoside phosphoramidase [bioreactor metagenome]|uniref:Purine nucleoside phosphoramidase n=1 Tax=bioreactor metagenome TaxID=1076179 RepID=A0A645DSZ4_9ZZZZ